MIESTLELVCGENPTVLILGSFPGTKSLEDREYYANPRNLFWPMMSDLLGISSPDVLYERRIDELKANGVALWDVVKACDREGSMDHKIGNPRFNDIQAFVEEHPSITRVVFNGRTAERLFKKSGCSLPARVQPSYRYSTSPACAIKYDARRANWSEVLSKN